VKAVRAVDLNRLTKPRRCAVDPRIEQGIEELARRAGLKGVPPAAVVGGIAILAVALGWALMHWWPESGGGSDPPLLQVERQVEEVQAATTDTAAPQTPLLVHITGAVRHPGVYELESGSRVADAVDAAGGLLADAVQDAVNLARPVNDGEQIVVPDEDAVESGAAPVGSTSGPAGTASVSGGTAAGPVNINTADVAQLDTLPGVGPSTAEKILSDREANGPFQSVDDLGRVSGIGPKRLEQLRDLVTVR
jgi:competence protein ComEA